MYRLTAKDQAAVSGLCSGENTKNSLKTDVFKLFSGAEGEIRTLARFLDDYSLSRGAPSASWVLPQVESEHMRERMAERVGFEPTAHRCVTGFQDQLLKPLGHLSESLSQRR